MALSSKPPMAKSPAAVSQVQGDQEDFGAVPALELYDASKRLRAQIYERRDGLYGLEFERLMPGDPEYGEPSYWSPINRPKTIVDTIDRAREMALEGLAEIAAPGSGRY